MISTSQQEPLSNELSVIETSAENASASRGVRRVAYVVSSFEYGGLERCVAWLVNHLDRTQFDPMIVCLGREGRAVDWINTDETPVINLEKRQGNDLRVVAKLAKVLKRHQVDIVHSHNWGALVETVLARRWAGVRSHDHAEHGLELADLKLHRWKFAARRTAMRWALNRTDAVVVVAESVREKLVARSGVSPEKIRVVPNGVELAGLADAEIRACAIRASLGIQAGEQLLGSVGRLAPVKDFGTAINALAILRQRGQPVHLAIVGDGPERERLISQGESSGFSDFVHVVGQKEDVAAWYLAMDLYLNSSLSEGMNLGIMEALAAGVPVVATDVGANNLLVTEGIVCGRVVRAEDPASMADAIADLLAQPELRKQMSEDAQKKHQREFSTQAMTERYADLYRECAAVS